MYEYLIPILRDMAFSPCHAVMCRIAQLAHAQLAGSATHLQTVRDWAIAAASKHELLLSFLAQRSAWLPAETTAPTL